jgi:hypothetical protein
MDSTTTFGQLPDGADLLAVVGGYRYLSVAWVMRQSPGERPEYYCPLLNWPETPAAQLAARDATIAELRTCIAELEARLCGQETEVAPQPTTNNEQRTPDRKIPAGRVQCPHCDKTPWSNRLADHLSQAHPEQLALTTIPVASEPAEEEPTLPAAPLATTPDDPTWRCDRCQSNVHARSVARPDLCVRCAAPAQVTNGHLVAA